MLGYPNSGKNTVAGPLSYPLAPLVMPFGAPQTLSPKSLLSSRISISSPFLQMETKPQKN